MFLGNLPLVYVTVLWVNVVICHLWCDSGVIEKRGMLFSDLRNLGLVE